MERNKVGIHVITDRCPYAVLHSERNRCTRNLGAIRIGRNAHAYMSDVIGFQASY